MQHCMLCFIHFTLGQNVVVMAYNVHDIAKKLILLADIDTANGGDNLTNMKLQKLLYYEQGFHLAAFGSPLFDAEIEAWMYGPVVPCVYAEYSRFGRNSIPVPDDEQVFLPDAEERLFIDVYDTYKDLSAIGLMKETHNETPWKTTMPHKRGSVIPQSSMQEFFKTKLDE